YTGRTVRSGGYLNLENDATLLTTSAIELNTATLSLSNNSSLQTQNNNRVGDTVPITLRSGNITLTGRAKAAATETLGVVTAAMGANTITATPTSGTNGSYYSTDLTLNALVRNQGATVNFSGTNLGQQGNNSHIYLTQAPVLPAPGVLGPWAIANSTDFAAYNAFTGVGAVGQGGYVGYAGDFGSGKITNLISTSAGLAAGTNTLVAGGTVTAMLRIGGTFQNDVAFANGNDVLNLELGGLLRSNESYNTSIGTTANRGVLTAGGTATSGVQELVVVYNGSANSLTINSLIKDLSQVTGVGSASLALLKSGTGTLMLSAANTYTGGTTVSGGILQLGGSAGSVVIPNGGLTISGASVTMLSNSGQIAAGNTVTLNNSASLNLVGDNTLNSLLFNNYGSSSAGSVQTGGSLTLTNSTPIVVTSQDAAFTPSVSGTLAFSPGNYTFKIGAIQIDGRTYTDTTPSFTSNAVIGGAGVSLVKSGEGVLQAANQSTFDGGLTVTAGGLSLQSSTSLTSLFVSGTGLQQTALTGPIGTGALTMAANTRLLVDDANSRTLVNAVTFQGSTLVFDKLTGTGSSTLTLNGSLSVASTDLSISVSNPNLTVNLAGQFANAAALTSITKNGLGNIGLNLTGVPTNIPIILNGGTSLSIYHDDGGTSTPTTIALGTLTFNSTALVSSITVGRSGQTQLWNQAANKTIAPAALNGVQLSNGLSVTNNNGYGLLLNDAIELSSGGTFTVSTASASDMTQGLTLNGVLSGSNGFT
ncbi:MAG: hypothetical protein EBS01_11860, partial [Verrucomicrobia bacterium]|nr:hypothetical protein [Verrucomicrobiota bacterium]